MLDDLGIRDSFVLYTDVDVMFRLDVVPLLTTLAPKYFAAGPEFDAHDYMRINTGVMLMNVGGLRSVDTRFRRFVADRLPEFVDHNWDQGAYRRYFGRSSIAMKLFGARWDALPPEFNWKPHWGPNERAAIVHFHGPKPQHRDLLRSGCAPGQMKWMMPYASGAYDELTDAWTRTLLEAE
jgi:lipopolysaccharide biosynthesis glycosyltransferase